MSNVPHLTDLLSEGTRHFIYLVDEFYDRGVKPVTQYLKTRLLRFMTERSWLLEIERTRSRLLEMQSDEYLQSRASFS